MAVIIGLVISIATIGLLCNVVYERIQMAKDLQNKLDIIHSKMKEPK